MKYVVYIIVVLLILSIYFYKSEGFINFEIDYGTGIGPWWAQGAGLNRGFHRCNCYGSGVCKCINTNPNTNNSVYPQYYFN
jgi:hypothetical protein